MVRREPHQRLAHCAHSPPDHPARVQVQLSQRHPRRRERRAERRHEVGATGCGGAEGRADERCAERGAGQRPEARAVHDGKRVEREGLVGSGRVEQVAEGSVGQRAPAADRVERVVLDRQCMNVVLEWSWQLLVQVYSCVNSAGALAQLDAVQVTDRGSVGHRAAVQMVVTATMIRNN